MFLKHHGVKGQKWGVRRYQNYDGSLTAKGKQRLNVVGRKVSDTSKDEQAAKDIKSIHDTLTKKERKFVGMSYDGNDLDEYSANYYANGNTQVARFIGKYNDTPVSAFILTSLNDKELEARILTRNDDNYRGKGIAVETMKQGLKWVQEHNDSYDTIIYHLKKDNTPSRKTAEKAGLEFEFETDEVIGYQVKLDKKKDPKKSSMRNPYLEQEKRMK